MIFEGTGSLDAPLSAFESAAKRGAATYRVNAFAQVKRLQVDQGTLEIGHDYDLANDGTLQTRVDGDGTNCRLKVDGQARLAGELNVVKGPGLFQNGTQYEILKADPIKAGFEFSTVKLPAQVPLLSFRAETYPDRVVVKTVAKSCTFVARNPVEMAIARYLDRVMPKASGDL